MASSYYSAIFDQSADEVWNVIRDFNNYPVWVDGAGESEIEAGKSGEAVGAVRRVLWRAREYARNCLRCLTWNARRLTNLLMRRRRRCKITGQPCELCPSLMVIGPSWSGGQRSIASPSAARSVLRSFVIRSGDGLARCGELDKVQIARAPSPSRAA